MADDNSQFFDRNKAWTKPGEASYNTTLLPIQEVKFREWVKENSVPFDTAAPVSDYDMRGFWSALQSGDERAKSAINPNDKKLHYPDYWKTPYHETFSADSQWADADKAPHWNENDQLVMPDGTIIYDEKDRAARLNKIQDQNRKNIQSFSGKSKK